MKKTLNQISLVAVIAVSCWQLGSVCAAQDKAAAEAPQPVPSPVVEQAVDMPLAENARPYVFHNYYVQPAMDGTGASLYPAPMPVPAYVGQTQITYEPFLPHEYMYRHSRVYYTPHGTPDMFYSDPCRGGTGTPYTKTRVHWGYGGNHLTPVSFSLPGFTRKFRRACGATCR